MYMIIARERTSGAVGEQVEKCIETDEEAFRLAEEYELAYGGNWEMIVCYETSGAYYLEQETGIKVKEAIS